MTGGVHCSLRWIAPRWRNRAHDLRNCTGDPPLGRGGGRPGIAAKPTEAAKGATVAIEAAAAVAATDFEPIRYRPIPTRTDGSGLPRISLDGTWKVDPQPTEGVRNRPLDGPPWKRFQVPGQWRQQGLDLPQKQTVAVAKEFTVPKEWCRPADFLRFDAIHAGTQYWLNGERLGYSENLFTPVEWEISRLVRRGASNRLDLAMTVDTVSEKLSYSCEYAYHNLGGIDRSRAYLCPAAGQRTSDAAGNAVGPGVPRRRDRPGTGAGQPAARTGPEHGGQPGVVGPDGRPVTHSMPRQTVPLLPAGTKAVQLPQPGRQPAEIGAEKPNLYHLAVEITQGDKLLERIERQVGFARSKSVTDRSCSMACRSNWPAHASHEIDPLTGRADTMLTRRGGHRLLKAANLNYLRTSHYPPAWNWSRRPTNAVCTGSGGTLLLGWPRTCL